MKARGRETEREMYWLKLLQQNTVRLGGFNNTKLFSIVLEAGTSKTKLLEDSVLSEGSLPDLQMRLKIHDGCFSFSLLSGMGWREGWQRALVSLPLLTRTLFPIVRAPFSQPHLTLSTSQRFCLLIPALQGLGHQQMNGRTTNIHSTPEA